MSDIKKYTEGSKNPKNIIDTLYYKLMFARDNPDYFYPSGIWVYCGAQGSGKTLSLVQTLQKMCKDYPKALVCSNLEFNFELENQVIPFTDYEQITTLSNGVHGIIFVIDEIHTVWNSLESKDVPVSEMACFCQMRKDRRVILGTSQVYGRISKPIREQLQYIINCRNFFGLIQYNEVLDPTQSLDEGTVDCEKICNRIWFHSPSLYKSYDTLFKIKRPERKKKVGVKKYASSRS